MLRLCLAFSLRFTGWLIAHDPITIGVCRVGGTGSEMSKMRVVQVSPTGEVLRLGVLTLFFRDYRIATDINYMFGLADKGCSYQPPT